jgi:hypothetical protein
MDRNGGAADDRHIKSARVSVESAAAAIAMDAAKSDSVLASEAAAYFRKPSAKQKN